MVRSLLHHLTKQDFALRVTFLDLRRTFWSRSGRGRGSEKGLVGQFGIGMG